MGSKTLPPLNQVINEMRQESAEQLRKRIAKTENTYLAHTLLFGEGLDLEVNKWQATGWDWTVDVKDLNAIRRALGALKLQNTFPVQGRENAVWNVMVPKNPQFAHLTFRYKKKLKRGGKCKIVRTKCRSVSRSLVCS